MKTALCEPYESRPRYLASLSVCAADMCVSDVCASSVSDSDYVPVSASVSISPASVSASDSVSAPASASASAAVSVSDYDSASASASVIDSAAASASSDLISVALPPSSSTSTAALQPSASAPSAPVEQLLSITCDSADPFSSSSPLKFVGSIDGEKCVVCIDTGATKSFISSSFVEENELSASEKMTPLRVMLADGSMISSSHIVRTSLSLRSLTFPWMMHVVPLYNCDVILGMDWLIKMNADIDWNDNIVSVIYKGEDYLLYSGPGPPVRHYAPSALDAADASAFTDHDTFKHTSTSSS
jgi:Retroviral aspartyl protease